MEWGLLSKGVGVAVVVTEIREVEAAGVVAAAGAALEPRWRKGNYLSGATVRGLRKSKGGAAGKGLVRDGVVIPTAPLLVPPPSCASHAPSPSLCSNNPCNNTIMFGLPCSLGWET